MDKQSRGRASNPESSAATEGTEQPCGSYRTKTVGLATTRQRPQLEMTRARAAGEGTRRLPLTSALCTSCCKGAEARSNQTMAVSCGV
jgi:hypothetical protein